MTVDISYDIPMKGRERFTLLTPDSWILGPNYCFESHNSKITFQNQKLLSLSYKKTFQNYNRVST